MNRLQWIRPFEIVLYSRNGLHRHRLEKIVKIDYNNYHITLANGNDDKIKGIIAFSTPIDIEDMAQIEDTIDLLFTKLKKSLLLKGYSMKLIEQGKLQCTNCPKDKKFHVSKSTTMRHNIEGKTKTITVDQGKTLNLLFKEIFSNRDLEKISDRINDHKTFSIEISDFIFNWISFNKQYNPNNKKAIETKLISIYVSNLKREGVRLLYERNQLCFKKLSKMNIEDNNYNNISKQLESVLDKSDKKTIIDLSLQCVYQIRNKVFHVGNFEISDLPIINNFIFDIINHKILNIFNLCNLTSFYDVDN